jgi:hypothetical protein
MNFVGLEPATIHERERSVGQGAHRLHSQAGFAVRGKRVPRLGWRSSDRGTGQRLRTVRGASL